MLNRILLGITIVAGLAIAVVNFTLVKEKVTTLQSNLKTETEAHQKFEKDWRTSQADLKKTTDELNTTKTTLEATTTERDTAVAAAAAANKKADSLNEQLTKTRSERDDAQQQLAQYKATGWTAERILQADKTMKALQSANEAMEAENKILLRKKKFLETQLAIYNPTNELIVYLPPTATGKVVVSDPKWNFVVVNVGQDQGVLPYGELLVNRNGQLVAKVRVTSVQKDRSIANVVPGWLLSEVFEGDIVIPAHPES